MRPNFTLSTSTTLGLYQITDVYFDKGVLVYDSSVMVLEDPNAECDAFLALEGYVVEACMPV
jgi:hypothetical protein